MQDVLPDDGLDDRVLHVRVPPLGIALEGYRAGITAEHEMALEVVAERRLKFSEAPVMDAHDLETSGQALRRTAAQAQRARTEQHDPQAARIGVPQGLHGLGPVGDLLHLVDDEERPFTEQRGLLPLL